MASIATAVVLLAAVATDAGIVVGENVRVSRDEAPYVEPYVASDPAFPGRLIAAATRFSASGPNTPVIFVSSDGGGTWLGEDMRAAYRRLHREGHAHSFETWLGDRLVGGLYGVAIGRMFFGESMFSRATDASKVALVGLVEDLRARGMPMIDCQQRTPLLASLGAREIPRRTFLRRIAALVN